MITNKYFYYLALFLLISLATGCKKDIIGESDTITLQGGDPITIVESSVFGIVTNEAGEAVSEVTVEHRGSNYVTDENGYFFFDTENATTNGGYLSFSKAGYFDNYKFFRPVTVSSQNFVRVVMVDQALLKEIDASAGGTVTMNGGAQVTLPAGGIVNANGQAYSGSVKVYAHWYSPDDAQLVETMPGDLRGTDLDGQRVQLSTFGMIAVELKDTNGAELNIADGQTARLLFPTVAGIAETPDSIPTWSYDEDRGYWREEGVARLGTAGYIADVSHFSFWNTDAKFPTVTFCMRAVTTDGDPISFTTFYMKILSMGITSCGQTDDNGRVCGEIPKDEELLLFIKDECGGLLFSETIGPFTEKTDIGDIVVEMAEGKVITIKGQLSCNGAGVTNGYLHLTTNNNSKFVAPTDLEGNYKLSLPLCDISKITVQAYDLDQLTSSEAEIITTIDSVMEINQEVCGELDEYIRFSIDGIERLIIDPSARQVNNDLTISGTNEELNGRAQIRMSILNPIVGTGLPINYTFAFVDSVAVLTCGASSEQSCDNTTINITDLGQEGDYLIGSFGSELDGSAFVGEFKILLDELLITNNLNVSIWEDNNENGLWDDDEKNWFDPEQEYDWIDLKNQAGNSQTATVLDLLSYNDLEAGSYILSATAPQGYSLTDKTIDGSAIDPLTGLSDPIIFTTAGDIKTILIGLKPSAELTCSTETTQPALCNGKGFETITVFGSTTDSLIIRIQEASSLIDQVVFDRSYLFEGQGDTNYQYEIQDVNGNPLCNGDFTIDVGDSAICQLETFIECDNGVPTAYFWGEEYCPGLEYPFTYEWSTGSTDRSQEFTVSGNYSLTVTDANGCTGYGETTVDFEAPRGIITGKVWEDNPSLNDGISDPSETLSSDVEVLLLQNGAILDRQLTNDLGRYAFREIPEGNYQIGLTLPENFVFAEQVFNALNEITSDINVNTMLSEGLELDGCVYYKVINIGIRPE